MRFDGKVAFITGAAHGIGASEAINFAREGANIVAVDICQSTPIIDYNLGSPNELDKVVLEIKDMGRKAISVIADVSKIDEVKGAVAKALAEFGRIDILVNNAGVLVIAPLLHTTEEQIDLLLDVNIKGVIHCCQSVIPQMVKQRYGKIINISSGAGLNAEPGLAVYAATKYAVLGLTEALAAELAYYNINVNAICPGRIRTPMHKTREGASTAQTPEETAAMDQSFADTFFRREVTVKDIANAVLFLASDEASNITSHWLPVTAGVEKIAPSPSIKPYFTL